MILQTLNAAGKPLAPPVALDPRRRRLSQVIGRHVDRTRPHMIAIQRARDPLQPIDEAWVVRGRDRTGEVKPWPSRYLPADAIVVVVYLPRGGGGSSSGSRSKSPLNIALGIAGLALVAFAGPLGAAAAGALSLGSTAGSLISAGLVLGATALISLASRSKANKQATDTTQIYGVAGGGNLPKPGDRIPRGYGRSWMKPDLSQPDFTQYDGDDQILFKRHTLGLGKYHVYQIRAGKQVIWTEATGFVAPFNDPRNAVEVIYGTTSTLVPSDVISAAGVGGLLPRPSDNPAFAGPYPINQRGALISRILIDFQYPQGISAATTDSKGVTTSNRKTGFALNFQFAPIDESGAVIGQFTSPPGFTDINTEQGLRFGTHPMRYSRSVDVPPGRYTIKGANLMPDTSEHTGPGLNNIDAGQWDGAYGFVADAAVRPGITEIAFKIYATKATGAAAFSEIEVDAAAIIPVWDGSQWSDQETSKAVWAFLDIMRNQDYGGAVPDDQLDLGTALGYANSLTEFDTFDGTIRGPVSVYEAATTVLLPMRAEPVHLGRYWSLVRDEPKAVRRHVITRRQMLKGSSQITFDLDRTSGAAHVIGEFDQDGDYRNPNQTTAIYGEASLTPTRQRWTGVRTFDHAQHLTRWRAASGAFRTQTTPFGVEMEGRIYKRGDSISVDPWFIDVRKVAGVIDNDGDTLLLDADVPVVDGDAIVLRDRAGREWGPLGIAHQGASAREIVLDPVSRSVVEQATGQTLPQVLSDGRRDMTTILVGPLATLQENYLIRSVKPDGPDRAQVEALIDDPRVWEAIGATPVIPPIGSGGLTDPESPRILGLTANAVQIAAGLRCDFAINPGRGCVSFEVGLSYDDGGHYETISTGNSTTGSQVLNPVDPTLIQLRCRGFGATGLPGPYFVTELSLPAALIPGAVLNLDAVFEQLRKDLADTEAEIADLYAQVKAASDAAKKQAEDAQAQLAATVARMRQDVQDIAEAAATVEGDSYDNKLLLKAALQGRTQDAFAAIQSESKLRVSGDETLAQASTLLTARLGTAESAISTETTARTTADSTQAGQIATAYSRLTNAETNITGLASGQTGLQTQVTKNGGDISSLATQFTTLSSTVNNPTTGGTALANAFSSLTTRVTQSETNYTSTSSQINVLNNSVFNQTTGLKATSDAVSGLTSQTSNLRNDLNSVASAFTTLSTQVYDPNVGLSATATYAAQINSYANVINGKADAATTSLQTLSSTVGGNTASISTLTGSYGGLSVKYGVIGAINGQTGGFQLTGIQRNDGSVQYNVEIFGNLLVDGTIIGQKLVANSITTNQLSTGQLIVNGQLFNNAVSQVAASSSGGTSAGTSLNVRGTGAIIVQAYFNGDSSRLSTAGPGQFLIYRDGALLNQVNAAFGIFKSDSGGLQYNPGPMAIASLDYPGVGGHSYTAAHSNGQGIGGVVIIVTELSK